MKRLLAAVLCLSVFFVFGCNDHVPTGSTEPIPGREEDSIESLESENGTYPITLPLDPEVEQSIYEASVSEEESILEENTKWASAEDYLRDVLNSKEFIEAGTAEQKAELIVNAMKELSEHGTTQYPEPLVIYDSWTYLPEYKEVTAKYIGGVEFSVSWFDYNIDSGSTVMTE